MNPGTAHLYLPLAQALAEGREQILLTPANAPYYLPLMQAVADGKTIVINRGTDAAPRWELPDHGEVLFTCPPHRYCVLDEQEPKAADGGHLLNRDYEDASARG